MLSYPKKGNKLKIFFTVENGIVCADILINHHTITLSYDINAK